MNPRLAALRPYPFERLAALLQAAPAPHPDRVQVSLAIGEPRHSTPHWLTEALIQHAHGLAVYPSTKGGPELRQAICAWLSRRFRVNADLLDPEAHVLPVNGTREALFSFAQAVVAARPGAKVLMPNPFYQIYEGAALLAGAQPYYLQLDRANDYLPDLDAVPEQVWRDCELIFVCTPGNPAGAAMPLAQLQQLIELADRYDFVIASDECYSELYLDESAPPPGLLQACAAMGRSDFARCVAFHSLSKRSNAPGLRSGFVAGDAAILRQFLLYRTYHGCAMPTHVQAASTAAWRDEQHVIENRQRYRAKFAAVEEILAPVLDFDMPAGGFYLWPRTPIADTEFAQRLYAAENIIVLPGSFLSRTVAGHNPGTNHVRIALVASEADCIDAARRLRGFIEQLI